MKTVLVLAALIGLVAAGYPLFNNNVKTKTLDPNLVNIQKKVLLLLENWKQVDPDDEYYKIGKEYNIEANIEFYTNREVVTEFLSLYKTGFTAKNQIFSIYYENQALEVRALYRLFYYAKDFETFYKTAAFARVWLNEGQFIYAFYIAVIHRADTRGIVLPAPYEIWPEYFVNSDVLAKINRIQMQKGLILPETAQYYGVLAKDNAYYFYANYSGPWTYENNENLLSYFIEDVAWNSYYYYFHSKLQFWEKGENAIGPFKERRGEIYYFIYQQILARYYLERLSNGLGEIPRFNWNDRLQAGYYPLLTTHQIPFAQRNGDYYLANDDNIEDIQFVDSYEKTFLQFLQKGQFKAYKQEVDLYNSKSVNFVGNYWQANVDLYEKVPQRNYLRSYEDAARRILGAAPRNSYENLNVPTALDFYQTSLRDPAFYQLYAKILDFINQYKEYLEPYTQDVLHFVGVKINDVKVDKLVTYFEYFDWNATNAVYLSEQQLDTGSPSYIVRQPRLNNQPFTVTIDIKSDVESEAVIKIFIGPKYDGNGYPIDLENNWVNLVEIDWFTHKLTSGQNKIERKSENFFWFKEDSVSVSKIYELLNNGQVPRYMIEKFLLLPRRLLLPRGTEGGVPFQFFVFVYPYQAPYKEWEPMKEFVVDNKPFGYPFDRPVTESYYFTQPNMYFKDVYIYQEGEEYPYYTSYWSQNQVPKH
ncbi:arylphorin-like [Galleria mellonella]|uniref:Arylphorin-like n=1 Tax=Galleria mellonella TaxID=7137 RepID=A0ABM3N0F0_GALME|nr:arylphorin-like [Galleria mellonella]